MNCSDIPLFAVLSRELWNREQTYWAFPLDKSSLEQSTWSGKKEMGRQKLAARLALWCRTPVSFNLHWSINSYSYPSRSSALTYNNRCFIQVLKRQCWKFKLSGSITFVTSTAFVLVSSFSSYSFFCERRYTENPYLELTIWICSYCICYEIDIHGFWLLQSNISTNLNTKIMIFVEFLTDFKDIDEELKSRRIAQTYFRPSCNNIFPSILIF